MAHHQFAAPAPMMLHRPALLSVVENTRAGDLLPHHSAPQHSGQKVVYFVRHGQSEANIADEDVRYTAQFRDARLTAKGHEQARALQEIVPEWGVQTIYTSPLTRALQTTCLAFEHTTMPIVAWPTVTEFYPHMPECQGRNASELREALELTSLNRFKDIRLEGVVDKWWRCAGDRDGRLAKFLQWLAICPETRIAVVAHWGFIHELLAVEVGCDVHLTIHNCNYIRTVWATDTESLIQSSPRQYGVFLLPTGGTTSALGARLLGEISTFFKACQEHPTLRQTRACRWGGLFHFKLTDCIPLYDLAHVAELHSAVKVLVQTLRDAQKEHGEAAGAASRSRFVIAPQDVNVSISDNPSRMHVSFLLQSPLLVQAAESLRAISFKGSSEFPEACFEHSSKTAPFKGRLFSSGHSHYDPLGPVSRDLLRQLLVPHVLLEEIMLGTEGISPPNPDVQSALEGICWEVALVSHDQSGPRTLRVDEHFPI